MCVLSGLVAYILLMGFEASPDPDFKVQWQVALLYYLGGKETVAGLFVGIGALIAIGGVFRKAKAMVDAHRHATRDRKIMKDVAALVNAGKTVEAMKLYRELTGATLAETQRAIAEIRAANA